MLNPLKARMLLERCVGDQIWPAEVCRQEGVPEPWIEELADSYESGFLSNSQTIYFNGQVVNQFHGVQDLQIARKLAEYLGVDTSEATRFSLGRKAEVDALKEAVEEL